MSNKEYELLCQKVVRNKCGKLMPILETKTGFVSNLLIS